MRMKLVAIAGLVALLLAAGAYSFTFALRGESAPREVILVAKDMAFVRGHANAGPAMNPPIVLGAGERVRLVVRNQDPGMKHDFVVDAMGVHSSVLEYGESETIEVTAPAEKGETEYYCSFHALKMRGRIIVR